MESSFTSTEDEEESEMFRESQLLDLDGFLEFDDLDGIHALMVRTLGVRMKQGGGRKLVFRERTPSWVSFLLWIPASSLRKQMASLKVG